MGGTAFAALAGAGHAIDTAVPTHPLGGAIGFDMPNIAPHAIPAVLTLNAANLADAGGPVHPLPPGAPAIPIASSNYDGNVEIFQD